VEAEAEERAGRVQEEAYAHELQEVVGDDSSTSDHMAVAAAAGRDRSAVDSADRQGVSMDVAVVADWSATAHAPWKRHWRAVEAREVSSRD
jgi:hypothetical protein